MGDPEPVTDALITAVDAFSYATGRPRFEPDINSSADADDGEVAIQKACRLLETSALLDDIGPYFGAIVEQSFIAIEQTMSGYLLAMTGIDERSLRDHRAPYQAAIGQVPLEERTIETVRQLFDQRRSEHYYSTVVSTADQAESMHALANVIHHHLVAFDPTLERYCRCQ